MSEASLAVETAAASTSADLDGEPLGAFVWPAVDVRRPYDATLAASLQVERMTHQSLAGCTAAWADLCRRALDSNVFLEPGFALPLMRHLETRRRPEVIVVWQRRGEAGERLVGLFPVSRPRLPMFGQARGFRDKMVALGVPLLDRDCAAAVFAAMLGALDGRLPRPVALALTGLPAGGLFVQSVLAALQPAHQVSVLASHERAVLRRSLDGEGNVLSLMSAKTRKERNRQRRRMADHGSRAYVSARSPEAVALAIERFLALEYKGWKGARGTALLANPNLAAFARDMTRDMAATGQCRIDALEVGGQAVAMGIILTSGSCAHFWKTAFDEALAPLSPGVQFAIDLAEAQFAEAEITLTDSCAMPDHPMIDKLWPDRMEIVDVAIGIRSGTSRCLSLGLAVERSRRRARDTAKRLRAKWRGGTPR